MSDPLIETALANKLKDIEAYIASLEQDLAQARRDHAAIAAAKAVFGPKPAHAKSYMNIKTMFARGELPKLAKEALRAYPDGITTQDIARHALAAKGADPDDSRLRRAVGHMVIAAVQRWAKRGEVMRAGNKDRSAIWATRAPHPLAL